MSLKIKLISCISLFMLMIGVLIIGVFAATQTINLKGNVEFNISDTTLYVKDIRVQTDEGSAKTIPNFMPGYTNTAFDLNLGTVTSSSGIVTVYFDFINTTSTTYSAAATGGNGVILSTSGTIEGSEVPITDVPTYEGISGTITLTIQLASGTSGNISLDGMSVTLEELYIQEGSVLYVNNVTTKTDTSEDTIAELNGGRLINDSIDLSGIEFAAGETTLTISMTSLSAKYIKNIVSYDSGTVNYNTTGTSGTLFVHSTSLYLPQNASGELASGESKDLTIYVNNNTSSATTISGFKVSFEEKESLLQKDTENKYWYVEMGTVMGETESEYIRWKYIASVDDSSGSDVATKYTTFDADSAPTGKGYFYLETNVLSAIGRDGTKDMIEVSFNNDYTYAGNTGNYHNLHGFTNVEANDYATSNIRQYINGNNVYKSYTTNPSSSIYKPNEESRNSNMYTDLNINTEDAVFGKIATRTIGELYKDNTNSATNPNDVIFPDLSGADEGYQYQKTDKDAFWLLSYYEINNLVGSSRSDRIWPTGSANAYWLRSPNSSVSGYAYCVSTSGGLNGPNVGDHYYAARAAFKFSI